MHRSPRVAHGWTLIEAVITLLLVALLSALALPALHGALSAASAARAQSRISETVAAATTHAAITGAEVVVCSSEDGNRCAGSADWSQGWIAYADLNANREHDPGETLLRREGALQSGARLRTTVGRTRLVFQPHGGAAAGSNATFTVCDARGPDKAASLVLSNSGRLRQAPASRAAATACLGDA